MPETRAYAPLCGAASEDQASGLRRLFDRRAMRWQLVLQPTVRCAMHAQALADRVRDLAAHDGATLVIDAARSQVALPLGLRLRYDLEHVLAGDCAIADTCVRAVPELWVLPAARALDRAAADEHHAARVAAALESMASEMRQTVLLLPAGRVAWLRHLPQSVRPREALVPILHNADASAAVLTAVRMAVSEAEIDTFRLLFLGMGEAAAGRLLSAMAAIAQRHFGATLLAAEALPPAGMGTSDRRCRHRPVENVS